MAAPTIATVPGVTPILELGLGSSYNPQGTAQWQVSRWGQANATWAGREPQWFDVTCEGLAIETATGRERSADTWEVGTATVQVRNLTGWAEYPLPPELEAAIDSPLLAVQPGREIRIGMEFAAAAEGEQDATHWLYRGVIDGTAPDYNATTDPSVELACIDAKGDAGRAAIPRIADPGVGANESAATRINRILDKVKYPAWRRAIAATGVQLLATTFGEQAVDMLNRAADSAGGAIFGNLDGKVDFRPRDWQTTTGAAVVEGTIGNMDHDAIQGGDIVEDPPLSGLYDFGALLIVETPAGSGLYEDQDPTVAFYEDPAASGLYRVGSPIEGLSVCPSRWEVSFARSEFTTQVIYGRRTDDVPQTLDAPADEFALIGLETYERTDLETVTETDLDTIAARWLDTRSVLGPNGEPYAPRIAAVHIDAGSSTTAAKLLATISPLNASRVRCQHAAPDGRVVFNRLMMVTGIQHTITPDGWTARVALDVAAPYELVSGGRWQTTGRWAQTTWAHPV